ncbi:MAG: hypothetical protein JNJ85_12015 [Candidatus Kapabacteria bacterium]|nr:hypothetical protein [Candidatus Kapabacteria bacterium]
MATTQINLSVIQLRPCTEQWETMQCNPDGTRHCAECKKNLTDFRNMSVQEIHELQKKHAYKLCGVYYRHQVVIARNVRFANESFLRYVQRRVAQLVGIALTSSAAFAQQPTQQETKTVQTVQQSVVAKDKNSKKVSKKRKKKKPTDENSNSSYIWAVTRETVAGNYGPNHDSSVLDTFVTKFIKPYFKKTK